jgi:hypothetical protein
VLFIGTQFSNLDTAVNTSAKAASYVQDLLQALYKAVRMGGGGEWRTCAGTRRGTRYFNTGCAGFSWFLSFGNRTRHSRVSGARPNHQPIGDLEPTQGGAGCSQAP